MCIACMYLVAFLLDKFAGARIIDSSALSAIALMYLIIMKGRF